MLFAGDCHLAIVIAETYMFMCIYQIIFDVATFTCTQGKGVYIR